MAIPCFNEGATIPALVRAVCHQLPLVVVVDDGSTDDTPLVARAAGATVARHAKNLGKGAALKTGLSILLNRGYEWAFTLDGDGQHNPDDMPSFLRCAEQTDARLVIGNRMQNAQAMPWLRRQMNRWMSRRISRFAATNLPDTQCGFRLIHLGTWATLPLATAHFEVESETLVAFLTAGHRVEFVPIAVIGGQRPSRIAPMVDSVRWWKWWCALRRRN